MSLSSPPRTPQSRRLVHAALVVAVWSFVAQAGVRVLAHAGDPEPVPMPTPIPAPVPAATPPPAPALPAAKEPAAPARPAIDVLAPKKLKTATFALG